MRFQAPVPGVEIKYSQAWSIKKFPGHLNQIFELKSDEFSSNTSGFVKRMIVVKQKTIN